MHLKMAQLDEFFKLHLCFKFVYLVRKNRKNQLIKILEVLCTLLKASFTFQKEMHSTQCTSEMCLLAQ